MSCHDDGPSDSIISTKRKMETVSEILSGELYLSSLAAANQCSDLLISKNITRIISIIQESFPKHKEVEYMVLEEDDSPSVDLAQHFDAVNKFICDAKAKGSAVLIHCKSGISRSATLVIAYIMYTRNMTAEAAYEFVKSKRNSIMPNLGFINQLQQYEGTLRNQGKYLSQENANDATSPSDFLVQYLRSAIPNYTKGVSDDQINQTVKSCDYSYIQVLASLRAQTIQTVN